MIGSMPPDAETCVVTPVRSTEARRRGGSRTTSRSTCGTTSTRRTRAKRRWGSLAAMLRSSAVVNVAYGRAQAEREPRASSQAALRQPAPSGGGGSERPPTSRRMVSESSSTRSWRNWWGWGLIPAGKALSYPNLEAYSRTARRPSAVELSVPSLPPRVPSDVSLAAHQMRCHLRHLRQNHAKHGRGALAPRDLALPASALPAPTPPAVPPAHSRHQPPLSDGAGQSKPQPVHSPGSHGTR